MASAFTHAFFAAALGTALVPSRPSLIALGALYAVVPDADVVGFAFGIPYAHMFGHRGASHSLAFAGCAAVLLTWAWDRRHRREDPARAGSRCEPSAVVVAAYLFLAMASHGVLDALTDGGLGVAFFAPFAGERFFFPWRPIVVSPISVRGFFTGRGIAVLASELLVVWLPTTTLALVAWASRRWRRRARRSA
jgi:inner membrane protein